MKILCHGDPHLKIGIFELSGQFLDWFRDLTFKLKPDAVINLGDTLDSHGVIRAEVMSLMVDHIDSITNAGYPYYQLLGNHEFNKPSDKTYHSLKALKGRPNHYVVDERMDIAAGRITLLPYIVKPGDFPRDTGELVFCHQTFLGADYGYVKPGEGVEPNDIAAEFIVSGHIHLRQHFGKVFYPGSPFAQSANDIGQTKGAFLIDTETFALTFFESPLPKWETLAFTIENDFTVEDMHYSLQQNLLEGCKTNWLLEITGPKAPITTYLSGKFYKGLAKGQKIKLSTMFTDKHRKLGTIKATSTLQVALDYASNIYRGTIDKDVLAEAIRNLVEKTDYK